MAQSKNQHFVPQFYFRNFSKNGGTICLFNLNNKKVIPNATIRGQCSKDYFYSKDTRVETEFSHLEGLWNKSISNIINTQSLNCLNEQEKHHLKAHLLFQHGRTEYARESEEETANALFDMMKPKFLEYAKEKGMNITPEEVKNMKIKSNSRYSLFVSMISGMLLFDLEIALLENKSKTDFVFSDNPVILFNSFFNDKILGGTQGIASTGLQIYCPVNSRLALFLFDPNFYDLGKRDIIHIRKDSDVQRLNGLQIIYCNENLYFEDIKMEKNILLRYNQIKSKRPLEKTENRVIGSRIAEDGTYRELCRTSSSKIKYDLEKLSFLSHRDTDVPYGIRNPELVRINRELMDAVEKGEVRSQEDLNRFFDKIQYP